MTSITYPLRDVITPEARSALVAWRITQLENGDVPLVKYEKEDIFPENIAKKEVDQNLLPYQVVFPLCFDHNRAGHIIYGKFTQDSQKKITTLFKQNLQIN